MKLRLLTIIAVLPILLGCTTHSGTEEYDRAQQQLWMNVSESDFRPPTTTPYDSIPTKRNDYLKGYAYGVREQLRQFRTGQIIVGDRIPPNDTQKPFADGERDGQLAVLTRPDMIAKAVRIDEEMKMKSQQEAGVVREPRGGSRAPQP